MSEAIHDGRRALRIDILGFPDCPNVEPTVRRVREAAAGLNVEVRTLLLNEHDDPARLKFLGSPTVLIAELDIEPAARLRTDYGFGCRIYGRSGTPPRQMIDNAVHEASARMGQ